MAAKVFGIDLGTTNSCISHVDAYGRPEVLANLDGDATTPSVVLFDTPDDVVVGKQAKRQARIAPDRVASLVKRHMGEPDWRFAVHNTEYSAPAVASLILKSLATDAERAAGTPVTDVVITVPAYFGDEERKATKLAGEYAGLNVVDLINEPTAAAFAYGFAQPESGTGRTVMVYDLGGGTFDITIIQLADRAITVVATDGDHELGGADWDERIATHLSERFRAAAPGAEDPLDDSYGAADLITAAEDAKHALSTRDSTDVLVIHGGQRASITVSRDELEELTSSLLQRTLELTRSVIAEARARGVEQIDQVLLVGGSSKMPVVRRRLSDEFGYDAVLADPDLAVAKGAALYGQKKELEQLVIDDLVARGALTEGQSLDQAGQEDLDRATQQAAERYGLSLDAASDLVNTQVTNVCSRGFGVLVQREDADALFAYFLTHRNDRLPLQVDETFYTVSNNQTAVNLRVFEQGGGDESERVEDNNILIEGAIEGIPAGFERGTEVKVTFAMAADGTLDVIARHPSQPDPLHLRVETGAALSAEEVAAERTKVSLLKRKD